MSKTINPLSAEFLYELYSTAMRSDLVCSVLVQNMHSEYLPDRTFQRMQEQFTNHFISYKRPPSLAVLTQTFSGDIDAIELINTITDSDGSCSSEIVLDMLESYIKGVRLQKIYTEVGKLYNQSKQGDAEKLLKEYAEWLSSFTLKESAFIDVVATFTDRFKDNQRRTKEGDDLSLPQVTKFYIDYIDSLNEGRNLRGQLSCFLASTGVGKSHIVKHIGVKAMQEDGLHILHFQLEGSEDEALNAYSGGMIGKNAYLFEKGAISNREMSQYQHQIENIKGSIVVRCFPRFNARVSTLDIKNSIAEYRKSTGKQPDIIIIDSMDLLTDATRRMWGAEHERGKRIAVANDLKDLAADEKVWMVVTYQATIENRDWLDNPKNVLTEYNCSEAKGLSRPCTHLISLNQTSYERKENQMRLHIAKSRFFRKGDSITIATDYDNEVFYDVQRSLQLHTADKCEDEYEE